MTEATTASETAAGATAAATTQAAGATTTTAATTAASGNWYDGFKDADVKGWVQGKGYESAEAAANGHRNVEKLLGVPADQIIKLPGKDAKPEDWNPVWAKLGRPETAEGYKLPVPEGVDPAFSKEAAKWMHEENIPAGAAAKLAEKWNAHFASQVAAQEAQYKAKVVEENGALKTEWGGAYDQNINVAKAAAREFGVEVEAIEGMEKAVGFAKTMKFFHSLGSKMGEASFQTGDKGTGFQGGIMTPAAAQARINELKRDISFGKRLLNKDADAKAEWDRLNKWANPGPA